ncbi:Exonuclease, RNase T/DNA polymerase III [Ostreococcus tauri]|uniref:RNA exonuclease 4 n=1 Tax=Ostreococcus tauri TaxID=70448 RepID=A0A090M7V1_OSTTA|nr:Exonuclease, RNase T/DNA polymerase III [Ostreococcus tauri]CEF98772.1 Exonuclease, RNase T/DNA polymerase III [Ostreococcus tauri]|eukprot:XP_022839457.1 Exonuclease, RNase T/DNA polymerase III [Ostreococcus tauri]
MGAATTTAAEAAHCLEVLSVREDGGRRRKVSCACCHKIFPDARALEAHWTLVQHSEHDAVCAACGRHFPSFDTLRQHVMGKLPKASCAVAYAAHGCDRCYEIFDDAESAASHECVFRATADDADDDGDAPCVALDCEFVGVGETGEEHACARVCIVDSKGKVLLNTWVNPGVEVTDYRETLTGAKPEILERAPPLEHVRGKVINILIGKAPTTRERHVGVRHLLVGHSVEHDLEVLNITWKKGLQRDTAQFPLYLRHTHLPFKLRTLVEEHLGERIQEKGEIHDPEVDARCAMRLYQSAKRRDHRIAKLWFDRTLSSHPVDVPSDATSDPNTGVELLRRTIEQDGATRTTRFYCWCQDRGALIRSPPSPPPADVCSSAKRKPAKHKPAASSSSS